ncbi:MAG: hypothetical protein QOI03_676, partial [Solirubrobacteraceae bacterium]|nr:hypothetical protein [Solirubrobacteraceae bacterium]
VEIGKSARLGRFIVLRDVYGDLFTYAGLGSIAPSYPRPKSPRAPVTSPAVEAASTRDPAPSQPASAGRQLPLTLSVKTQAKNSAAAARAHAHSSAAPGPQAPTRVGTGKVRLFAHPGNPDALAAAASAKRARVRRARSRLPLRKGAVVASGTVLGRVSVPRGAQAGHLRFAIRPAGDSGTVDPRAILTNWSELQSALHPQGARAQNPLLGATASDVLLLSRSELERALLADPGVSLDACSRLEVASGKVDRRALAVLAFLSRSGLKPTARTVQCSPLAARRGAVARAASEIEISAISGIAIAGHQGSGTITDLTIRTLLTLPDPFLPDSISSLMRYPGSPSTRASAADRNRIRIAFLPAARSAPLAPRAAGAAAHSAHSALSASPLAANTFVSAGQWDALIGRIAALHVSSIRSKPSSAAIADPKHR